ncbi:MAG TPA: phosphomannomutase [Thiolapillus brandeum]|uniref:phosphomannomutase n=1 Tax=Thiolapillus brandeum TaxID=1076588 RepID=A0A831NVN9_9GAMM|nr:phosphomannomutase [Thiolapillus brandeum]
MEKITCFKAYDVRGRIPDQLNEDIAYRIGRAYAAFLQPKTVVVGEDIRLSSPGLLKAVVRGLTDSGVDVKELGLCGTEVVYFATDHYSYDGGIMVTASHNPMDYNGLKFVREGSRPISADTGLEDIRMLAEKNEFAEVEQKGLVESIDWADDYIQTLLGYVDRDKLKPLKIVANPGNGGAGPIIDLLEEHLPFEFIKINHEPDGTFPNGIPNPILPENRQATIDAVLAHKADFGIAWDGDYDRCFLFDETGRFIEGYYIVGLLAEAFLAKHPGSKIIYDPRVIWNTIDIVESAGGIPIQSVSGHAFIKQRMREEDAIYGGEMSAHHYFRDFAYCDSGQIPWLLVAELVSVKGRSLSSMLDERIAKFPTSGEINFKVKDAAQAVRAVEEKYLPSAKSVDRTDGLSLEYDNWRFNLRASNTEPVLRLNLESRGDQQLLEEKTQELSAFLSSMAE